MPSGTRADGPRPQPRWSAGHTPQGQALLRTLHRHRTEHLELLPPHRHRLVEQRIVTGAGLRPEETDVDDVRYWAITPDDLVRQIVYAIDQPWGITINDITVRATGEDYVR